MKNISEKLRREVAENKKAYDEVPYPANPIAQTHIAGAAALGKLFGMEPAPLENCRVLELGCSDGGNLFPMAVAYPGSEFVGVDLSEKHIELGNKRIGQTRISNIQLAEMSLLDFDETYGTFDYIITHGVYSWVPEPVRDKILSISSRNLAPNGISYVSYNALPGWRMYGIVRDMLHYRSRGIDNRAEASEKALDWLNFLTESVSAESEGFGALIHFLKKTLGLAEHSTSYFVHEYLERENHPVYFYQFMESASRHGLQFIAETDRFRMAEHATDSETTKKIKEFGDDIIEVEQYLDFLRNRTFRQTLLCHEGIPLRREIEPERVYDLFVASPVAARSENPDLTSNSEEAFQSPNGNTCSSSEPVIKAALVRLGEIWPKTASFEDLLSDARKAIYADSARMVAAETLEKQKNKLADVLLRSFFGNLIDLLPGPRPYAVEIGEKPEASVWARCQADEGEFVSNMNHHSVELSDRFDRELLKLLDGTRGLEDLTEKILEMTRSGDLILLRDGLPTKDETYLKENLPQILDRGLKKMAANALLLR